jgi:hypothetical protein
MLESVTIKLYYGIGEIIYGSQGVNLSNFSSVAANVRPALVNAMRKIDPLYLHHLHPHRGTTCRRNTQAALCSLGSSRTTRFIRNVAMKILNSLSHVICT